ncbi:hypothetical protein TKK_0011041 [Trichogramma kaykai]|uniref:cholesterol 7-desaturase n=1 Tax=Trichogramma kaykai TaxID=54128 RepID=A0ABD2WUB9_9HYME
MYAEICATTGLATFLILLYWIFFGKIVWKSNVPLGSKRSIMRKHRSVGNIPPIYPNGWFALAQSSEIKNGQVKQIVALGENFAVYRTENGIVRIVDAYCPHLGANMGIGGKVRGEDLECPFHSWRFCGATGKCTYIPYAKKGVPDVIKATPYECLEVNDLIFVWYHSNKEPPTWWPEPIPQISNRTWTYQGYNEFFVNCHIQDIPENGADWAHLTAVHGPSILDSYLSEAVKHSWTDASWTTRSEELAADSGNKSACCIPPTPVISHKHIATSCLKHNLILFNKYHMMEINVKANQIGPGYVELQLQTKFGPMCIVQTVTPVGPLQQRVTHLMFSPLLTSPYAKLVMLGECIMFQRDVDVWNHKKYMDKPMLVSEDKNIKHFRRWYKQFYSISSPTYESAKDSLEW